MADTVQQVPAPAMTYLEGMKDAGEGFTKGVSLGQTAIEENISEEKIASEDRIASMQDATNREKIATDVYLKGEDLMMQDKELGARMDEARFEKAVDVAQQDKSLSWDMQKTQIEAANKITEAQVSHEAEMLDAQNKQKALDQGGQLLSNLNALDGTSINKDGTPLSPTQKIAMSTQILASAPMGASAPGVAAILDNKMTQWKTQNALISKAANDKAEFWRKAGVPITDPDPADPSKLKAKVDAYDTLWNGTTDIRQSTGVTDTLVKEGQPGPYALTVSHDLIKNQQAGIIDANGRPTEKGDTAPLAASFLAATVARTNNTEKNQSEMTLKGYVDLKDFASQIKDASPNAVKIAGSLAAAAGSVSVQDLASKFFEGDESAGTALGQILASKISSLAGKTDKDSLDALELLHMQQVVYQVAAAAVHTRAPNYMVLKNAPLFVGNLGQGKTSILDSVNATKKNFADMYTTAVTQSASPDYIRALDSYGGGEAALDYIYGNRTSSQPATNVQSNVPGMGSYTSR